MANSVDTVKKTRILDTPAFRQGDTVPSTHIVRPSADTILRRDLKTEAHRSVVFLIICDLVERVELDEKLSAVVGRADLKTGFLPEVDLTRYDAQKHGVSRAHARLHRNGVHLYITDLCSDNGTFIRGNRLIPDVPYILGSGDELVLGCLKVKVLLAR